MTVEDVANRSWSKMFGLPVADLVRPGVAVVAGLVLGPFAAGA